MKSVLMGTTAVALVGLSATPAAFAEWNVRAGGHMEQYLAYADVDIDDASGGETVEDVDAWVVGTAIRIDF